EMSFEIDNILLLRILIGLSLTIFAVLYGFEDDELMKIDIERYMTFNFKLFLRLFTNSKRSLLGSGLFIGLLTGYSVIGEFGIFTRLIFGLFVGVSFPLLIGLFLGILNGVMGQTVVASRNIINQGLRETLIVGLGSALIACSIISFGLKNYDGININNELAIGMIAGLAWGMISGIGDVLQHLLLRWVLMRQNLAPRRYDHFLMAMVERRLMRRVGGSVIFIHRYLLEYFANEWERRYTEQYQ
ncbi:MAG: hypothetical protein AAF846_29720, partial [Chloroflexota bacterium]